MPGRPPLPPPPLDDDVSSPRSHHELLDAKPFRKFKVADVASVDASDTLIENADSRKLHETAKWALQQQDYERALDLFDVIYQAQNDRFGSSHPSVAAALHNVAVVRQRMQQHEVAETLFQQAVQLRENSLGPSHLEVAASLSKLGATQVSLKKFDDAFDNLRRAQRIATDKLGRQHKTVAQILAHLACLYFEAGQVLASQATFEDALEIYRKVWSKQEDRDSCMLQLTDTLCNIGSLQNKRKRYSEAIASFSEALDLQRGILATNHPRLISTLDNLGYSHSKHRDYENALHCYKTMMRAQVSQFGNFTEECYDTLQKQTLMLEKLGRLKDSIRLVEETLKVQDSLRANKLIIEQTESLLYTLQKKLRKQKQ